MCCISYVGDPAHTPIIITNPHIEGWNGYIDGRCISRPRPGKDGQAAIFKGGIFVRCTYYKVCYDGHGSFSGLTCRTISSDEYVISSEELSAYLCSCNGHEYAHILEVAGCFKGVALTNVALACCGRALQMQQYKEKQVTSVLARNAWIETLPEVEGFILDRIEGEISDDYGNYLFRLPAEPVKNYRDWLKKEFKLFLKYGE